MCETSPILIVGCRRSGTTLMRTILEGHTDLLVHPDEPQFFLELFRVFGLTELDATPAIKYIVHHKYTAPEVAEEDLVGNRVPQNLRELTKRYFESWLAGHRGKRPVLKHPALAFYRDAAEALFPGFTVIHVVRDPRANVSSQRQRWPHISVFACAIHWRRAVRAAREWSVDHAERYVEIQYESLVLQPERTIRELCRQLSIPYDEDLLSFRQKETVYEPGEGARTKVYFGPDESRLNLWRRWLTSDDVKIVESVCAEEMSWWDYTPVSPADRPLHLRRRVLMESFAYYARRLARSVFRNYRHRRLLSRMT